MAFVATASTKDPRSFSMGPYKVQLMTYAAASGDTSGTITADRLSSLDHILVDGKILMTTATSFSGNVATITFQDPTATITGTVMCFGK